MKRSPSSASCAASGQSQRALVNCGRSARKSSRPLGFSALTPIPLASTSLDEPSPALGEAPACRGASLPAADSLAIVLTPDQIRYSPPTIVSADSAAGD